MNGRHPKHPTPSFIRHWRRILVREEAGAVERHSDSRVYTYEQRLEDAKSAVRYAEKLGVRIPRSLRHLRRRERIRRQCAAILKEFGS